MPKRLLLVIHAGFMLVFSSCRREVPAGRLPNGQIALTFDDASVDNWHQHLGLLDSLHIKATFYISSYHTLKAAQKEKLKQMEGRGHEIAYHTTNHRDLLKEVERNGMARTEATEIKADLTLMKADGYHITNFAYPYGNCSVQLNTWLLRYFKSVRALSNHQNYNKSLVGTVGDWKVLYGANVDNRSHLKEGGIVSLMNKAQTHNDCLVLVAHQINNPYASLQISRERLVFMSKAAADRNLEFVTINCIAK